MISPRLQAFVKSIFAGVVVLASGTAGYVVIEDMNAFDALYMTTITVTTIGFKEVFPLSTGGRVFTMLLAFAGVGVILLIASEFARVMLETDLRRVLGIRRELKLMKRLRNHIVVCGHGRMGRAVVDVLRQRGIPFVVVETDPERCSLLEDNGLPVVRGDATEEKVLASTNITEARTIITCLADDAHNVYTILLARQLNPKVTVIARAVESGAEERLRLAGADRVLNPYTLGGTRLALTALKPTVTDFIDQSLLGSSVELELAEIVVDPSSELAGKTLAGAEVRRRFGIIVVALKRGDRAIFNPGAEETIEGGDVLVALGPLAAIERVERAVR
ncbi:MAG: potassium channel protein [Thermoanaerobaculales bacterium]|nr:potassium channel protein [Thermoanaerobaculales bacterium]